MLTQGIYTKEEIAKEFNISAAKAVNITRKLTQLNYEYKTSGKGATYRIEITKLPGKSIRDFVKEYLGIAAQNEDKISHFLYLLFALEDEELANYSTQSYEWITKLGDDKIKEIIEALEKKGAIKRNEFENVLYATQRLIYAEDKETGDYYYTLLAKPITQEEVDAAQAVYDDFIRNNEHKRNDPDEVWDEIEYYAQSAKLRYLNWWRPQINRWGKITPNKEWEHYNELMELLAEYDFQEWTKEAVGNRYRDLERQAARMDAWEEQRQKQLEEYRAKNRIEKNSAEKKKIVSEEPKTFEQINYVVNVEKPKVKTTEEWIKFVQKNVKIIDGNKKDRNLMRTALLVADDMFAISDMMPLLEMYAGGAKIKGYTPKVDLIMNQVSKEWLVDLYIEQGFLRIKEKKS